MVLFVSVKFEVTFAMDFSNDMPSVPPSGTDVLLWAKSAAVIRMNNSNISRLIPISRELIYAIV